MHLHGQTITKSQFVSVGILEMEHQLLEDLCKHSDLMSYEVIKPRKGVPPDKYLIHFDFKPFLGLGLSIVHPVNWASNDYPSDSTPSNPNTSCIGCGNDPFLYTNIGDGSSIVKNHFGAAIQTGFRLQFKKEHKERLTLNFIYSQGLVTLLKTPYEEKIFDYFGTGKLEVAKATFASRGTYWSIYATYPITLVNKKGERRRDRK